MKKVIAILLVFVLVMGCCVSVYAEKAGAPGEKQSMIGKFFSDLKKLLTKDIPETPKQKSSTQLWEPRSKGK